MPDHWIASCLRILLFLLLFLLFAGDDRDELRQARLELTNLLIAEDVGLDLLHQHRTLLLADHAAGRLRAGSHAASRLPD